jgi:hypothetical protein
MRFSLALFVTTLLGSMLGRHFYNTAHFNKVCVFEGWVFLGGLHLKACGIPDPYTLGV